MTTIMQEAIAHIQNLQMTQSEIAFWERFLRAFFEDKKKKTTG